ncbi:MAG: TIGR00282 family metallophosphoesterase [Planctomycetota bacterium]|nr:TIGR00282 family metallophosphoesterase [Planctomycetota bacterium]
MRILMIGDIVGKPGYRMISHGLPKLIALHEIDLVVANAENAADGSGLTPGIYQTLMAAGVDCITLGDHIYRRREIVPTLQVETNIVKPANFPREAPGQSWATVTARNGKKVAVISLLGRVFMRPVDCPWQAADRVLAEIPAHIRTIMVDFHAEATSDMQLMGRYLDGRVSAVLGTHTHVPTADERILPEGTAFQCDVGMTGPYESILGRKVKPVRQTTLTFLPERFEVATEDVRLSGTLVDTHPITGKATAIQRLMVHWDELEKLAVPGEKSDPGTP